MIWLYFLLRGQIATLSEVRLSDLFFSSDSSLLTSSYLPLIPPSVHESDWQ